MVDFREEGAPGGLFWNEADRFHAGLGTPVSMPVDDLLNKDRFGVAVDFRSAMAWGRNLDDAGGLKMLELDVTVGRFPSFELAVDDFPASVVLTDEDLDVSASAHLDMVCVERS